MFNKKGVSLITVLMFMLVATIAATATFKYLTSENRSSASRMEIQEARQSAYAGIQSTRAWMTNNANDVGAIIRHYNSKGKPILLNNHTMGKQNFDVWVTGVSKEHGSYKIKILSEGKTRHGAKYTEAAILKVSGLYQVKLPVDSAKVKGSDYDYSYFGGSISNHGSVQLSSMLINGNWFGNPPGIDKNIIITGNAKLSGDKVDIYGTGCIGGNFYADNGVDAKNLYVHGTSYGFGAKTKGISNHAYFDGVLMQHESKKIEVGGNLTIKNLFKTSMGTGDSKVNIKGNLCLDSAISQIQLGGAQGDNPSYNQAFEVHGDVWASHPYAFYARGGDFSDNYNKLILGKAESKLYIPDAYHLDEYNAMRNSKSFTLGQSNWGGFGWWSQGYQYKPYVAIATPVGPEAQKKYCFYVPDANDVTYVDGKFYVGGFEFPHDYHYGDGYATKLSPYCSKDDKTNNSLPRLHVSPWFKSDAKKENVSRNPPITPVACADSVKQVCYDIWEQKPGCDGADFKVDDVLKTAYDKFEKYASYGCAAGITEVDDSESNDFSLKMNQCYSQLFNDNNKRLDSLYNGYLVVKVSYGNLKQNYREKLKGHFIIILTNRPSETIVLPPTDGDANSDNYVFLYLSQGAFQFQSINKTPVSHYNYFIYAKEDVGSSSYSEVSHEIVDRQGGFLFNDDYFDGSVYAEVGTGSNNKCTKVSALTSSKPMVFNKKLLTSLTSSKVVCDISVSNCGGVAESSSSSSDGPASSSSSSSNDSEDSYIVSIAPQLHVSLETQYIAMESVASSSSVTNYSSDAIQPSVLVLPRVIYLTKTANGKLEDYYSVLTLNRKKGDPFEVKNPSNVVCDGFSQTTGKLYDGTELNAGLHKCMYNATTFQDTVPFYVYVSDVAEDVPVVQFQDPNDEKRLYLNDDGLVQVHVGPATNPGGGKIKFDVFIDNVDELSGWTIEPIAGVSARRDSSSGSRLYFSAEITPQVTAQDVSILKVKTDGTAVDGDMYIYLTPPTGNCLIGSDHPYHVYVYARAYISRNPSLATYCDHNYEICNNTMIGDTTLYAHSQRDRCGTYNDRWMSVNGTSCSETDINNTWVCLTNTAISPTEVSSARNALKDTCEIVIPSENNVVSGPSGGDHYGLYGALVRKKVKVNVKFENAANNSGSKVTIKDSKVTEEYYCENSNIDENGCDIWVYTGVPIDFSYEARSEDNGNFVRWSCTGKGCPNSNTSYEDAPTYTFYDDGNPHNVTIVFKKDSHCYYDDFKDELINATTTAFCASGVATCVDTCATTLVGSQACQPKLSRQPLANWLMIYHNVGSGGNAAYVEPVIDEEGFIYASAKQDMPSILLRNKDVGHNGRMFSLLQTGIVDASNTKDFLNSGFVVRSDGKEHLILNIYGKSTSGSLADLTFRVCKVSGQSIISESGGNCRLVTGGDPLSITNSTFVKVKLVVENNSLTVTAIIDRNGGQETWQGELDISDFSETNDEFHTYVGLSLADPDFRVYDNGWISLLYNDCGPLESPSVSCYFDEYVKPNEYIKPYVTIQSGNSFENRNCFRKFYYNGCDNSTNKTHCEGIGFPGEIGSEIDSVLGYSFTQLGKHGVDNNGKLTKAAFVKMICPGNVTSIDLANDASSCGKFTVGYQSYCTKDVTIYNDSRYISANEELRFPETDSDEYMNLLGSELIIVIEKDGPLGANLTVQLEDANGVRSLSRTIDRTGATKISEWISSYTIDFDPQHVSKVIITSDASVSVDKLHIYTDCSNKLDLKCGDATFDYINGSWTVNVDVNDRDRVVCSVTAQSNNAPSSVTGVVGCNDLVLPYESRDWLFDIDTNVTFTIRAAKPNPPEDSLIGDCKIEGSRRSVSNDLTCSIEKPYIYVGNSAPNFQFTIGKSAGASLQVPYKVTIGGKTITGMASVGELQTINFPDDISINAGTTYTYKVEADLDISNLPSPCEKEFLVKDVSDLPTITSCKVDENGRFEYSISNPNDMDYSYTIAATDAIRNPLKSVTGTKNDLPTYFEYTPALKGTYAYSIVLTREGLPVECNSELKYPPDVSMSIKCPADITDHDPENTIVLSGYDASPCETPFTCEYKVKDADGIYKDFSGGSFSDASASGEKTYTLEASISKAGTSIYDTTLSCTFKVSFLGELAVTCPTENVTDQKPENISVNVDVSNCAGCSYLIDAITPTQSGSKFTFSDSDVSSDTESKKYTFKATDKYSRSKECTFNVVFASGGGGELDCFFAENNTNGGSAITGTVTPKYQMNICVSRASESKQTILSGRHFNGSKDADISKNDFWLSTSQTLCHYFMAPSTEGSYTFDVQFEGASVCKTTPILVVQKVGAAEGCIDYVNGVGGYDINCYKSGLENMAANTCYTMNPDRGEAPQYIENKADNTWWWVVTPCR